MTAGQTLLVSGATGLIGGRLVETLTDDGITVRALTRSPERAAGTLPAGASPVGWDGTRVPREALVGATGVVHLAGEPLFGGRLTRERRRRTHDSRVESTRALVARIGDLDPPDRPRVLVNASAVGFYGSRGDEELDEQTTRGEGFLAELCRDWEAAALAARDHGLRVVVLRIGVVLAREGGALRLMSLPFRAGLGGRLGDGRQWFPWIHADDVVALLAACIENPSYDGPVNAVAPNSVRNAELTRELGRAVRRPALLPVPAFALKAALGELSGELLGSKRVVPRRALASGFRFRHETIASALEAELS